MDNVMQFFAMGGYAFYVWTSYALTTVLLVGIIVWSSQQFKSTRTRAFRRAAETRKKS